MKIRAGNLCEICDGTEVENINWFVGSNWMQPQNSPYTITTGGNANIPITVTTLTPSSKKLKATWSSTWTGGTYTSLPNGYTVAPNTAGLPTGTITAVSSQHPIPLPDVPKGLHCSMYVAKNEAPLTQLTQPDANGNAWTIQGFHETKFMPNGTIGLIVHVDKDIARMLIEDRLYLVPIEKLKVIS